MDARTPQVLAQKISPQEIRTRRFKRALGGYAVEEVAEYLETIARAWEKVQRQEREMIDRAQALTEELVRLKGREAEAGKQREKILTDAEAILAEARREAELMLSETERRAAGIRERTEEWLESILSRIEETERQKKSFVTAFRSALDSHLELLNQETAETEPLAVRLQEFLKGRPAVEGCGVPG